MLLAHLPGLDACSAFPAWTPVAGGTITTVRLARRSAWVIATQISEAARGVQVQAISAICSFGMHLLHEGTVDLPDMRLSIRRLAR